MDINLPYDKNDKDSIIEYAKRLKGRTLNDFVISGEVNLDNKGSFGQVLESGYFHLENSNDPVPDFKEAGIELKSTPMKLLKNGTFSPKERLVLGIINYFEIAEQSFEESFMHKNENLLIVFYLYEENVDFMDYRILDVVEWNFSQKDIEIIRKDWNDIREMVLQGCAHELSGGMTFYLEAMTKGAGHGRDYREQPYNTVLAKQRAFGLKGRYLKQIFESTLIDDYVEPVADISDLRNKSIEDLILEKFSPYIGLTVEEILEKFNLSKSAGKSRYAYLARSMLGVKGNKIEEFEKANVVMRVIRPEHNGRLVESISFPHIRYNEVIHETWTESTFYETITSKFLFVIFQKIEGSKEHIFRGIKFWSISEADLEIVHDVWEDTLEKIRRNDYDNFVRMAEDRIVRIRPHARNREDKTMGADGNMYLKKSFWLNAKYIDERVLNPFFDEKDFH